jgi:large subunit ribosomal protein L4
MRAAALRSALSDRATENRIAVIDEVTFDVPKTKEALELLRAADIAGSVLLVLDGRDDKVERSFRNLPRVHLISVDQLNTYDVLARDWLVITRSALEKLNARAQDIETKTESAVETKSETEEPVPAQGGESA